MTMINKVINPLHTSSHWDGTEYRQVSLPQFTINTAFLNEYQFRGSENILDIGCGDGRTTKEIALKAPQGKILGIDASSSMIKTAIQENNLNNLHFQLLNAYELNFHEQFDLVTCFFCMQWVPDKKEVFQKIYHALKPNGHFLMIAPQPHPYLPKIRQELITMSHWKKFFENYSDPLQYINDSNYEQYAQNARLKISSFRTDTTPLTFSNYDTFFNFMTQMTPHISCLPSSKEKADFIHELIEHYLGVCPALPDGSYQLIYYLVKFHAYRTI